MDPPGGFGAQEDWWGPNLWRRGMKQALREGLVFGAAALGAAVAGAGVLALGFATGSTLALSGMGLQR